MIQKDIFSFLCNRKLLRNVPITQKRSARMRPDACGICLLKQTASGAQSVTSPSKIEGFREFEADLSALFCIDLFIGMSQTAFYKGIIRITHTIIHCIVLV